MKSSEPYHLLFPHAPPETVTRKIKIDLRNQNRIFKILKVGIICRLHFLEANFLQRLIICVLHCDLYMSIFYKVV